MENIKKSTKIHFLITSVINLLLVSKLLLDVSNNGGCKSILFIVIPIPLLIALNGIIGVILYLFKSPAYQIYVFTILILILAFIFGVMLSVQI